MPKYAEEILAAVTELQQHPKAEQVFLEMKREHPSIALGTVYLPPCREQEKTILWRRSIMNANVSLQRSNHIAGQREQPLRHQSQKSHKEGNREENNFLQDRHHIRHFLSVRSYYKGIDYCTARMSSIICTPAVLQLREFS